MEQSFLSQILIRFKEYRRQGFGRSALAKLYSRDELVELLFYYIEKEEHQEKQWHQNRISHIEKAEIIYEK